jgi:hypothetical protein
MKEMNMSDPRMGMLVLHWTEEGMAMLCEPTDLDDTEVLSILLSAVSQIGHELGIPQEEFLQSVQQALRDASDAGQPSDA